MHLRFVVYFHVWNGTEKKALGAFMEQDDARAFMHQVRDADHSRPVAYQLVEVIDPFDSPAGVVLDEVHTDNWPGV